jgi:hypothetical protein
VSGARLPSPGPASARWTGRGEAGYPVDPLHLRASNGTSFESLQMRNALALIAAAALTATAVAGPAQAHDRWPAIPPEIGTGVPSDRVVWIPYRCNDGPTYNYYHGAYYGGQPPAVFLDYAYRPFYRYTAYRVIPRTYFCSNRWRR